MEEELLPENLMFDILSRLPLKTIIYCKSVCKKWRNLILDSYFVRLHLSRSREYLMVHDLESAYSDNSAPGVLKCVEIDQSNSSRSSSLLTIPDPPVLSLDLNFYSGFPQTRIILTGSVDGLICIWLNRFDVTCIFNPVAKQYMILPKSKNNFSVLSYGFGVSTRGRGGEYKVIRICKSPQNPNPIELEVHTLGTDHWRSLGQHHNNLITRRTSSLGGLFFKGHVHWIFNGHQIYVFELDTETFNLFPSPPPPSLSRVDDDDKEKGILGVLKGCLSHCSCSSFEFTVWVMKEYGIKDSWYKLVAIKENITHQVWDPLCLLDYDDDDDFTSILMVSFIDKHVAYCLDDTNTIKHFNLSGIFVKVMTYRPSFLNLLNFGSDRVHAL